MCKSFAAGILIGMAGTCYCTVQNKYVAAVLFALTLLIICYKDYNLFTGKVGYLGRTVDWSHLTRIIIGNIFGVFMVASFTKPYINETATALVAAKLNMPFRAWIVNSFFCGIIMFLIVSLYKEKKTVIPILVGIPFFILTGFEHSIADIFYVLAATTPSIWKTLGFIMTVICGNLLGSLFIYFIGDFNYDSISEFHIRD